MSPGLEAIFCCIFLLPPGLFLQTPPSPGWISITSTPPHAYIAINGKPLSAPTNATVVVSPGNYTVVITGGPGNLNCKESVTVKSGQTASVTCPAAAGR